MPRSFCKQGNVAVNSVNVPVVLIFKVGLGAVTVDLQGNCVFSCAKKVGNVKFCVKLRIFGEACFFSVYRKGECGFNTTKVQKYLSAVPTRGKGEFFIIADGDVLFGNKGGVKVDKVFGNFDLVALVAAVEGVNNVCVDRLANAVHLPAGWNGHGFHFIKVCFCPVLGNILGRIICLVAPFSVKAQPEWRLGEIFCRIKVCICSVGSVHCSAGAGRDYIVS